MDERKYGRRQSSTLPFFHFPMNRIDEKFCALRAANQKGFIAYIGAGDPNLRTTEQLALAFDRVGVDVLELGVAFRDPLADGIVNQLAAQRALNGGATTTGVLDCHAVEAHQVGALSHATVTPGERDPEDPAPPDRPLDVRRPLDAPARREIQRSGRPRRYRPEP